MTVGHINEIIPISCRYVVVNFARQRFKTRPIKRTLNPKYPAQDATFDFPIYLSAIEQVGPLIEFTVWDKDFIGKSKSPTNERDRTVFIITYIPGPSL